MAIIESYPYTVTLDKMDYQCITKINSRNNSTNGIVPLWSASDYDDYYDFEIRASIIENEVAPTYKCDICNINVPIAYNKEHNESIKHKTYLNIIDIALKRVQQFMVQGNKLNTSDKTYNTYFCAPCATEVPLKDKKKHETTKQHAISVKHDIILKDFQKFYINDSKSDEYITAVNDYAVNEDVDDNTNADIDLDSHSKEITAINGSKVTVPLNNFHGFYKVGEQIQCRVCKIMIKDSNKMEHMLSKEHMDKVKVPVKDVHCIRKNDEIWSHCILCNDIIMDIQLHKLSSPHKENMKEAVVLLNTEKLQTSIETDNKDALSTLAEENEANKDHGISDLCLPQVEFDSSHIMANPKEMTQKKFPNLSNNGSENLQYLFKLNDIMEIKCRVCFVIVDHIGTHVHSDDHITKYNDILERNTLSERGDKCYCKTCNAYCLDDNRMSHIDSKEHKKLLKERYTMSPSPERVQYRTVLNKGLEYNKTESGSKSQSINNILQSSSNSISESYERLQATKTVNNGNLKTVPEQNIGDKVNSVDRTFEANSKLTHSQSQSISEVSYVTTKMKPSNTSPVLNDPLVSKLNTLTINDNKYYCKTCKVTVPNNEFNKREHVNGFRHRTNERLNENSEIVDSKTVNIINSSIINTCNENEIQKSANNNLDNNTDTVKVHYLLKVMNYNRLFCKVCEIFVNSPFTEIKKHIDSYTHELNYDKLLALNTIWRRCYKNNYSCDYCKVEIPYHYEIDHINGQEHAVSIKKITSSENGDEENQLNDINEKIRMRKKLRAHRTGLNGLDIRTDKINDTK